MTDRNIVRMISAKCVCVCVILCQSVSSVELWLVQLNIMCNRFDENGLFSTIHFLFSHYDSFRANDTTNVFNENWRSGFFFLCEMHIATEYTFIQGNA